MGNGLIYRVPMFQRDYLWEDLWQDIVAMLFGWPSKQLPFGGCRNFLKGHL